MYHVLKDVFKWKKINKIKHMISNYRILSKQNKIKFKKWKSNFKLVIALKKLEFTKIQN